MQKEIGAQGGKIVLGKVKFVFPAGALDKPVNFKVQQLLNTVPNGKFDIVNFLLYKLWINRKDGDTVSSTTVVCDDEIEYRVTKLGIDDIDDDLFVPIPTAIPVDGKDNSYITDIYINGVHTGGSELYGRILSNNREDHFTDRAPRVVPGVVITN